MKRFWKDVTVQPEGDGWRIALDGRPLKTQGGAAQVLPTRELADLLAAEWADQPDEFDAAAFPLRDMADYAIDKVAPDPAAAVAKIMRFAETDTLCYRADPDEPLHRRQWEVWEPLVAEFEQREGVRLERISGIVHRPQPANTLAALRARLERLDPMTLAALEVATSLAASLCVGLSSLDASAAPEALWEAAELEELWQVEQWGSDWQAEERREKRKSEFLRAVRFARAAGQ
ncbi:ATPase [Tsuneonella deserti]|uniref:ATPase n=1 Tax=Tsuneonella deserti TaxID=2035528 RepID=A0ABQ1SAY7_9SPHN|nr:ATP12 family protein [Tsuneonella deserti]GGD98946.1 ATPase [Tsuneonella deserti]